MHPLVADFMVLFEGYQEAYGIYNLDPNRTGTKAKGRAATIKRRVTPELWDLHLMGKQGLGIVPINEESKVRFGAIDVDDYTILLDETYEKITRENLPMMVCRTKSGGAHIYMFFSEWVDAGFVRAKLEEIAAHLGRGGSEIFPKQAQVMSDRGDVGQWINMPYFNESQTDRFAVGYRGKPLTGEQFLKAAVRITAEDLGKIQLKKEDALREGPPCLNTLAEVGFPEGTRNNGLLNMAIYAKKAYPDNWKLKIEAYNQKFMDPPLSSTEVMGVIRSLNKKDYAYTCKSLPIVSYCNANKCRGCKFGVGGSTGMPTFGTLTKLGTTPPIWFLDVISNEAEVRRLELSTEQLQSPRLFQLRCMEALSIMPPMMKADVWSEIVQRLLGDLVHIEIPVEMTVKGQMATYLEDFCTQRAQGRVIDDLVLGKPYTREGYTYFRMRDFTGYMTRMKIPFHHHYAVMVVKDLGGIHEFFNVRGQGVNCWRIPEFRNRYAGAMDVPEIPKEEF